MKLSTTINRTIAVMPDDAMLYVFAEQLPRTVDANRVILCPNRTDMLATIASLTDDVEVQRRRNHRVVIVADATILAQAAYLTVRDALDTLLHVADGLVFLVETCPVSRPRIQLAHTGGIMLFEVVVGAVVYHWLGPRTWWLFALGCVTLFLLLAIAAHGWPTVRPAQIAWEHMNMVTRRQIDVVSTRATGGHATRIQAADVLLATH